MRGLSDRGRIQFLLAIMAVVAIVTAAISLWLLYRTALDEERSRLVETAQSQARLIEAVARFDAVYSRTDLPGGAGAATLSQITDAHERYQGFGETGEFTLARREHDSIVFLLSHRHYDLDTPAPVPWESGLAEPMRRALSGQSGTVIGPDYRGVSVLAAYEPVAELDLGIVAKIDMAEVRRPFLRAAGLSGLGALLIIGLGVVASRRIGSPMVERLKAEEALKASEAQLRLVIDNLPALIVYIDADQRFRLVNRTCAAWFGRPAAEILGKRVAEIHGERYALFKPHIDAVLSGETPTFEAEADYPDGERRSIRSVLVPRVDPKGTVRGYFALSQDITQSKRAEKELREIDERFRDFAETASDWFWETDMEQRFTYFAGVPPGIDPIGWESPPGIFERVVGRTRREIWSDLQGRDPDAIDTIADYMARGAAFDHLEITHRDPEHGLVHVSLSGKPVTDDGGNVVAYRGTGRNITERKQVESGYRFQASIIETMMEGVVLVQLDNVEIVYANPNYEAMFGYGPGEMNGKHGSILNAGTDDEKRETARAIMAGINETGGWRGEVHNVKKDGTTFWGYATVKIMDHPEYGPVGVSIHTDITESKRAKEELRESEARYRALVELSPDAVYVHQDGRIIFANASTMSLLAASGADDIVGKPVLGFVAPEDHARVKGRISHTLTTGQTTPLAEFKMIRLDGALVDVAVAGRAIEWKGESAVLVVVRDVSEQKAKEQEIRRLNEDLERRVEERTAELRTSEARLKNAEQVALLGHWQFDVGTSELIRSDQNVRNYGLEPGQMAPTLEALLQAVHPDDRDMVKAQVEKALSTREPGHYEFRTLWPDGQVRTILAKYQRILDDGGDLIGILGINQDITERKGLEQQVLRSERLSTLGQLTATVSHELRNPLAVIRTSAFVVRHGLNEETPLIQRSLDKIERSVIRCDRIIDELLDFTRISDIEAQPTAIDAWLEEIMNEQALPSGVALRSKLGMPDTAVSIDRDRLRRAVINVFDNACQAMVGAGMEGVGSEAHSLTVRTQERDGRVEVIFEDTGPGMPPDVYKKIFEPLYSTKGFGVGLGLSVVKQIMEQHGGGIEIESEEGRGTRVCLWLPTSPSTH